MNVAIISHFSGSRLDYILQYIFCERLGLSYTLNPAEIHPGTFLIGYGITDNVDISIPDLGYLQQTSIEVFEPEVEVAEDGSIMLFPSPQSDSKIPFDLFAAVFYMLSRHEEYLSTESDPHGRFDAPHSFAFRHNFHMRAVVDEWVILLKRTLSHAGMNIQLERPNCIVTVDIDQLFSYKTKGWFRNAGGWFRDLLNARFNEFMQRPLVLTGILRDPFDTFHLFSSWQKKHGIGLKYFILAAEKRSSFDKNGNLRRRISRKRLRDIADNIEGLHPSYNCYSDLHQLEQEKLFAESITGTKFHSARRHFLRMRIPDTCRQTIQAGFISDYTLGFASTPGFRAGTTRPFMFYDLKTEQTTTLRMHPFCFMDGTFKDYQTCHFDEIRFKLKQISDYVKSVSGLFVIIVHNETLSENKRWKGWSELLEDCIANFYNESS